MFYHRQEIIMQQQKIACLIFLFLCMCISLSAMYNIDNDDKFTITKTIKVGKKKSVIRSTDESGKVTFCVQKIKTNRNRTPLLECTIFSKNKKHYYWSRYLIKENDRIEIWAYKKDKHIQQDYQHWQNLFEEFDGM